MAHAPACRSASALLAAIAVALLAAGPGEAADLAWPVRPASPAAAPLAPGLCLTGVPVEYHVAPGTPVNGIVPAGMLVEVIEAPWDPVADPWVRIKPPRAGWYYGWVASARLVCR